MRIPTREAACTAALVVLFACGGADSPTGPGSTAPTVPVSVASAAPIVQLALPANGSSFTQGAAVAFSVSASDNGGAGIDESGLVWSSNRDGTIGTGHSFTKNTLSAGAHTITVTARGRQGLTTSRTSIITVSAVAAPTPQSGPVQTQPPTPPTPPTPLPPAPPVAPATAEPAGMTLITHRGFDCATDRCEAGWTLDATSSIAIVSDPSAPRSAGNVAQMTYLPSLPGGSGPGSAEYDIPASAQKRTMYVSSYFKLSSNFQSHPTSVNKLLHFFVDGSNRVYAQAWGDATANGSLTPSFGLQGLAAPYADGRGKTEVSVDLMPNLVSSARIIRGQWHHQEVVLTSNTPGIADGSVEMWLDGTKIMAYSGIMFVGSGSSGTWSAVKWNPTWGGAGGAISAPFFMQMDDMYVSGK